MDKLTFMDNTLMNSFVGYEVSALPPMIWDRQTLAILCHTSTKRNIIDSIRRVRRPSSHSEGTGYEIDVFTNLDYKIGERDPAMRNIRVVYCDVNTMTMEAINERFPNSYIIRVKENNRKEISYDISRNSGREIPKVPRIGGCTQKIW